MIDIDSLIVKGSAKLFNSGFMFADGFFGGKRFGRYCAKCRDAFRAYLNMLHDTDADISDHILGFFMFWASDKGNAANEKISDKTLVCDWRRNLIPLVWCEPFDFEGSDAAVKRGWSAYFENPDIFRDDVFETCFKEACGQYLHGRVIDGYASEGGRITSDNFCMKAVPDLVSEHMRFLRLLLNIIWCYVYSVVVWTQQDRADDVLENHGLSSENARLADENEKLRSELEKIRSETIPGLDRKLREAIADGDSRIRAGIDEYRRGVEGELRSLRHKNKQLRKSVDELGEANRQLREQADIMESAIGDASASDSAGLPLDHNSRILFIAGRAGNGSVQGTYDRLLRRFPNSRMVHDPKDISDGFDCYVMLTKYIFTHGSYWDARDRLAAMGVPYIHSWSQNVDRIASDVFGKPRYGT